MFFLSSPIVWFKISKKYVYLTITGTFRPQLEVYYRKSAIRNELFPIVYLAFRSNSSINRGLTAKLRLPQELQRNLEPDYWG